MTDQLTSEMAVEELADRPGTASTPLIIDVRRQNVAAGGAPGASA